MVTPTRLVVTLFVIACLVVLLNDVGLLTEMMHG